MSYIWLSVIKYTQPMWLVFTFSCYMLHCHMIAVAIWQKELTHTHTRMYIYIYLYIYIYIYNFIHTYISSGDLVHGKWPHRNRWCISQDSDFSIAECETTSWGEPMGIYHHRTIGPGPTDYWASTCWARHWNTSSFSRFSSDFLARLDDKSFLLLTLR